MKKLIFALLLFPVLAFGQGEEKTFQKVYVKDTSGNKGTEVATKPWVKSRLLQLGITGTTAAAGNHSHTGTYQGALTLTTTGASGAATLSGNTLNIPQYGGGLPSDSLNFGSSLLRWNRVTRTYEPYADSTGTGAKGGIYLGTQNPTKRIRKNYNHIPHVKSLKIFDITQGTDTAIVFKAAIPGGETDPQVLLTFKNSMNNQTWMNLRPDQLRFNVPGTSSFSYLTNTQFGHAGGGTSFIYGFVVDVNYQSVKTISLNSTASGSTTPYILRSFNKVTGNLFELWQQDRKKFEVDTTGGIITPKYSLNPRVADGASAVGYLFDTHNSLSNLTAKLASWRNGGTERVYFLQDGTIRSTAITTVGDIISGTGVNKTFLTTDGIGVNVNNVSRLNFYPGISDGGSAVAYIFDTHNSLTTTGAKLASFKNSGTEKADINKDGGYTINNTYLHEDSSNLRNAITKWHRADSINTPTANVWRNVKFKTNVSDESTYGIRANSDSTGFVFNTIGVYKVSGYGHWLWNGAPGTEVKIYIRATQEGTEMRCTQTNDTRDGGSGTDGSMRYEGTFRITSPGQVVRIQYRSDNANLDWQGSSVFDSPVSFTVNFQKISR